MYTKEIYPFELTLDKANTNNEHCSFLNHDICIINRKRITKLPNSPFLFSILFMIKEMNFPFLYC